MKTGRCKKGFFVLASVCLVVFGCAAGFVAKFNKYGTPEKTWETYRGAIMRGDLEAALDTLAYYIQDRERKRHYDRVIGVEGMQQRVKPIVGMELLRSGTNGSHGLHLPREHKEYRVITDKGPTKWTIYFVKINGEWKIEALPF